MNIHNVSIEVGGKTLSIETGKLAKQSDGSVLVGYGDTRVLVTAVSAKEMKDGMNFFPLTVEFQERYYAAGKFPGGFLKREGRPSNESILSARMLDRPIRPLFPEGYFFDTQIAVTVLSLDSDGDVDIAAAAGAAAALTISDIPFAGPSAACRIGRVDGQWVINPSKAQVASEGCDLEILTAGTSKAITMIEGGAKEASEADALTAILKGHEEIKKICAMIEELGKKCGKEKREFIPTKMDEALFAEVTKHAGPGLKEALQTKEKQKRYELADAAKAAALEALVPASLKESNPEEASAKEKNVKSALDELHYRIMRDRILDEKIRIDGRDLTTIRPIAVETGLLPRVHGSSLFTRGETQVLAAVTLGTSDDEQMVDNIYQHGSKNFMLHYNFPPYSVGETGRFGGQSRREIGHGVLAERSVEAMVPSKAEFPYTLRVVCETLESNGSSSMGSVCSASMALMHAGVPMKKPVAGIAMGLIKEGDRVAVLSDILGDEDHLGDMDFKVAGTHEGITGIQMDIKIEGVTEEIMRTALAQAREGRLHILGEMSKAIETPQAELSDFAPRITSIQIPTDKIGTLIGPGGKMIKEITAQSGAKIEILDDGTVNVASNDSAAVKKAINMIEGITKVAELDKTYSGKVKRIVDFGAFVEILPNQEGLLHISEIAYERVERVEDYIKEGDELEVKVIEVDATGRVRLSRKALLPAPEGYQPPAPRGDRGPRGGGGGRGGDRPRNPRPRD
jgi:polyribonucleotide nucleotidyltransferase